MRKSHHSRILAAVFVFFSVTTFGALAQVSAILQVAPRPGHSETVDFDLDALDRMEQVSFSTTTIWTDGDIRFSGVPLKTLLESVDAQGSFVEMVALNDYSVVMPMSELEDNAPIIATRVNDEPMSVRDKGPFWVVFPFDSDDKYKTEIHYARSIWQLSRLNVME